MIEGPAVIAEDETSTVVPPNYWARLNALAEIELLRKEELNMAANAMTEINLQVMWKRLLSVVEEQAQTLVRTAFSTSSREAGDISAGVFDLDGQMLAQAVTGTPGHINSMARSVKHLDVFPSETMKEGDSYFTNDPWKGRGTSTTSPSSHRRSRMAGWWRSSRARAILVDIGGLGPSSDRQTGLSRGPLHSDHAPGPRRRDG